MNPMEKRILAGTMAKKRGIPRELDRAGALCLAFANTGFPRRDDRRRESKTPPPMLLARYEELVRWAQRMGAVAGTGERLLRLAAERSQDAAASCARAVELRAALMRIFTAVALTKEPRAKDLAVVNGLMCRRSAVPSGEGFGWDWGGDEDALDRPLWAVAQSAAEMLVSGRYQKVRRCATRGCDRLFVYANSRRLWCDDTLCGSRQRGRRRQDRDRQIGQRSGAMSASQRRG